jgi:hypothetical protein
MQLSGGSGFRRGGPGGGRPAGPGPLPRYGELGGLAYVVAEGSTRDVVGITRAKIKVRAVVQYICYRHCISVENCMSRSRRRPLGLTILFSGFSGWTWAQGWLPRYGERGGRAYVVAGGSTRDVVGITRAKIKVCGRTMPGAVKNHWGSLLCGCGMRGGPGLLRRPPEANAQQGSTIR